MDDMTRRRLVDDLSLDFRLSACAHETLDACSRCAVAQESGFEPRVCPFLVLTRVLLLKHSQGE